MPLAPILLAARGLTGELDPSRLITGDLTIARNVNFAYHNLLEKERGSAKINAVALSGAPTVLCGLDWWPTSSTQRRVVATGDGVLYKDAMVGTYATTLKSGLGASKLTQMVEGGAESAGRDRKLFVANGFDPVQVLAGDGATTANVTTPPADWTGTNQPSFMFPFRGSLIGAGNSNDPHRIYAANPANHEDFTTGGVTWNLSLYPGEGQRLVAGLTAFGKAFLWKYPNGIYFVNDAASTISGWFAQPASRQYGAAPTAHAVAQIDEAVIAFLSNTGSIVLMQESSGTLTGVTFTDLTKVLNLRSLLADEFDLSRIQWSQCRWYDDSKQLQVLFAAKGSAVENRRLVIDFNQERTRTSIITKDTATALWLEQDSDKIPRVRSGDNAGFTWDLYQQTRAVDGVGYTTTVQTAGTDFSDVNATYMGLKLFRRLHLEYVPTGDFNVSVEIFVDGASKGTVTFNMGPAGSALPFQLPGTLSGDELRRRTRAIIGEGHYFAIKLTESSQNNPRIARAWVEFDLVGVSR